jgi:hypothetical protein
MIPIDFSKKLMEISKVIEEKGDGICYILNEGDHYTIGTKNYNEQIAQYLNRNLETWNGGEANLKQKKGKNKQPKPKKVGYLWKIPIKENNLAL